ncbi:Nicastrin [Halotydeus destructor]|nr:Nicastrin [Halotydeus destructor]
MRLIKGLNCVAVSLFVVLLCLDVSCIRIAKDKIYEDLENEFYCFRRLNATHQTGCQSEASGNVGVLHLVEDGQADLDWILNKGPSSPYIAVVYLKDFTTTNLKSFNNSGRVNGVIVMKPESEPEPSSFSPDNKCPNENFGLYVNDTSYGHCNKLEWNNPTNPASSMMFQNWQFPIFLMKNSSTISKIKDCYVKFNKPEKGLARPWPLCAADLYVQQHAAVSTPKCMKRNELGFASTLSGSRFCDPLSSSNVFTTLFPTSPNGYPKKSVILLTTRLDSASVFNDLTPGVDSAITGMVTMLSVAKTLASLREQMAIDSQSSDSTKNILFAFFDGEAFDYIGSSSTVFSMNVKKNFPKPLQKYIQPTNLTLEHISHIIEVNQIGSHSSETVYAHYDPLSYRKTQSVRTAVDMIKDELSQASKQVNITLSEGQSDLHGMPPASAQSFIAGDDSIPAVVITNHGSEYTNLHYNSFIDNENKTTGDLAEHIARVSEMVSKAVFKIYTGNNSQGVVVDRNSISEMLDCFISNITCELFQSVSPKVLTTSTEKSSFPLYVSVAGSTRKVYISYVQHVLAFLTGEAWKAGPTEEACKQLRESDNSTYFYWMLGRNNSGVCINSPTFTTQAISPAFDEDNPDWTSQKYSTWTESVWSRSRARIFLKPSPTKEWFTFGVGLLVVVLSFFVVYIVERKASILFTESTSSLTPNMSGNRLLNSGVAGC